MWLIGMGGVPSPKGLDGHICSLFQNSGSQTESLETAEVELRFLQRHCSPSFSRVSRLSAFSDISLKPVTIEISWTFFIHFEVCATSEDTQDNILIPGLQTQKPKTDASEKQSA